MRWQDVARAEKALKDVLEESPPLGVHVGFELKKSGSGSHTQSTHILFLTAMPPLLRNLYGRLGRLGCISCGAVAGTFC